MALSAEEVRDVLLACFPAGMADVYDLRNRASDVSKFFDALAAMLKAHGTDQVDTLRAELMPSTATALLDVWERALALDSTATAISGTVASRRAQVVARLREWGTPTPSAILASLVAIGCPATTQILEHTRATLTTLITSLPGHAIGAQAVPAGGSVSWTLTPADNAPCALMGAQIQLYVGHPSAEDLSVTITAPSTASKTWASPFGSGAVDATCLLAWPGAAGEVIDGSAWTITVNDGGAAGGLVGGLNPTTADPSFLWVEGIGRAASGADGLAANIFEFAASVNESLCSSVYDRSVARSVVERWAPAHTRGFLVAWSTTGSAYGIYDDANSCVDGCTFA